MHSERNGGFYIPTTDLPSDSKGELQILGLYAMRLDGKTKKSVPKAWEIVPETCLFIMPSPFAVTDCHSLRAVDTFMPVWIGTHSYVYGKITPIYFLYYRYAH